MEGVHDPKTAPSVAALYSDSVTQPAVETCYSTQLRALVSSDWAGRAVDLVSFEGVASAVAGRYLRGRRTLKLEG